MKRSLFTRKNKNKHQDDLNVQYKVCLTYACYRCENVPKIHHNFRNDKHLREKKTYMIVHFLFFLRES